MLRSPSPQHWTEYVNAFGTVASAIAAIVVATFAYIEIGGGQVGC